MNYFLLAMFLVCLDAALFIISVESKKAGLLKQAKVFNYMIVLVTIVALICFSKL